ncbi:cryptococcal mannosyltransferase 1-domain-containing protein, partial [Amylocarpus encephaloides]
IKTEPNATFLELAPKYHQAFLTPEDESFKRLQCPAPTHGRYNYFRGGKSTNMTATRRKYFFALNLHQNTPVLPRLIGSVVEAMRFLGTEHCALSIVEGRSNDGTYEILSSWKTEMKKLGVPYYFTSSDVDPMAGDRIGSLATLRNGALQHLMDHPKAYSADASVIFLNDIAICMEDILELVHQRLNLGADMVCGMDWADQLGTFYDVWVSRTLTGDLFFPIPDDGSWDQSSKLFASDKNAKARFDRKMPFQVFACWNGGAVFTAKPLQEAKLKFRTSRPGECFAGEPTVFCKDMWWHGYGKIAVIPTVNVDYTDAGASHVKEVRGRVSGNLPEGEEDSLRFDWQDAP